MRHIPDDTFDDLQTALKAERAAVEEELAEYGKPVNAEGDDWEGAVSTEGEEADPVDAADQIEELAVNVPLVKELEERRRDIIAALGKMKKETYGVCEECGEDIDIERLEANPAARMCMEHAA